MRNPDGGTRAIARLTRALAALGAGIVLAAPPLDAQAVATRTLTKPVAEYAEPFTVLLEARELRDGRVVVLDVQDRLVHLVDARLASAQQVGRQGAGPGEYNRPISLLAGAGDTTLVYDIASARFVAIEPSGKMGRMVSLQSASGGMPIGPMAVRGYDRSGRLWYQGMNFSLAGGQPAFADSAPLMRVDGATKKVDTVAWVRVAAPRLQMSGDVQKGTGAMRMGVDPYPITDEWSLLPDGRLVIVRGLTYRVDVLGADGRLRAGTPVPYAKVKVTEADRKRAREATQRMRDAVGKAANEARASAGAAGQRMPSMAVEEPTAWPEYKPAFPSGALRVGPDGTLWVHRLREAAAEAPLYDVLDATGKLLYKVQLPPKSRLLGVSAKFLYVARADEDDLQYLQRFAR